MTLSAVITAVFTVGYLAVTAWLCRGLRLNTWALCYGGLICAAHRDAYQNKDKSPYCHIQYQGKEKGDGGM